MAVFKESSLHLRNAYTRLPFRYGNTCLTACPQAILRVVLETRGRTVAGYSGDALPPGWFDKRPGIPYRRQIADQVAVIDEARDAFACAMTGSTSFWEAWCAAYDAVQAAARRDGRPALLAGFGHSLVERAILDALCRADNVSFHATARADCFGVDPGAVHRELAGQSASDWLATIPTRRIHVRHTVGLADPLSAADVPEERRLNDGLPQSLQEYVVQSELSYFKIKVSNRLEMDLDRLQRIAEIIEAERGAEYTVTLDGNEQYHDANDFLVLMEAIRASPRLETLWANTLAIEQPLPRSIALDPGHTEGIRILGAVKPVIIDESDDVLDAYARAVDLGYRGVSSKACKGIIKAILNAGLTWHLNDRGGNDHYMVTGEDLTCVGMVPLQTDLALAATLGLTHVERNGHHYYHGLDYLPRAHQRNIAAAHPRLYQIMNDTVALDVQDGMLDLRSLDCPGLGFAIAPDLTDAVEAHEWNYDSLGLD